jgi:hypothetical protein
MHTVITVTLMPTMPTQPSMIEGWSLADLRCNVYDRERKRIIDQEMDRPIFSTWEGGERQHVRKKGSVHHGISWPMLLFGSGSAMVGGLWLLSILGFAVPWFSVLPMGLMLAGSFFIAAALNRGTASEMTSHDRCDH